MQRTPVDSTVVAAIGYDERKEILEIEFHFRNAVYQYEDVPAEVWAAFKASDSKGKYFNENIRNSYFERKLR
jgi:hypothetical protein